VVSETALSKRVPESRPTKGLRVAFLVILVTSLAFALASAPAARAQTFKVIYGLTGAADGSMPNYATVDPVGNVYGTAEVGGVYSVDYYMNSYGTVFKVNPKGAQTVLYTFSGGADGSEPNSVIRDSKGNLYGTTYRGGDLGCDGGQWTVGCGVVFKINKKGQFSVLHAFSSSGSDGWMPTALVADTAGNLYGTTVWGAGCYDCGGTIFKIDATGNESTLYSFTGGADGDVPFGNLLLASSGNLYGTTEYGGAGYGTIFKFNLKTNTLTTLYSFTGGTDGAVPLYLAMDASGNLYGNAAYDGADQSGTLFKLTPAGVFSVVHAFTGGNDGGTPYGALALDAAGNLYGSAGAGVNNYGVVFKVNLTSGEETVLYSFTGYADGSSPSGVAIDGAGSLYGVASENGFFMGTGEATNANGTVFKITP
jgi:uncharacterized repeat protein (TIGR03803 family)